MTSIASVVSRGISTCIGAPTPTMGTVTNVVGICDLSATWTIPWTGMTFGTFVIDLYRKVWEDAEAEPGAFTFFKRVTSGTSTTDIDDSIGSDGGGAAKTLRRKYKIRVVNVATPPGGTPHCKESLDSNQSNATGNLCMI